MSYGDTIFKFLIGRTIKKIYMNENYLKFETDLGNIILGVEGECCSSSYFHDFIGVKKLLAGNSVVSVGEINLEPGDNRVEANHNDYEETKCYGYEIVTEDPKFGEVTAVFSFRNSSNGYYGGWLCEIDNKTQVEPQIVDDVLEAVDA